MAADEAAANDLKRGDVVKIQSGPFAGYDAIFDARLSGQERVRVLLQLLSKGTAQLDLPSEAIRPKKSTRRS